MSHVVFLELLNRSSAVSNLYSVMGYVQAKLLVLLAGIVDVVYLQSFRILSRNMRYGYKWQLNYLMNCFLIHNHDLMIHTLVNQTFMVLCKSEVVKKYNHSLNSNFTRSLLNKTF